jgi:hypothetical protein
VHCCGSHRPALLSPQGVSCKTSPARKCRHGRSPVQRRCDHWATTDHLKNDQGDTRTQVGVVGRLASRGGRQRARPRVEAGPHGSARDPTGISGALARVVRALS